jgi:hypothetical protein
MAAGLPFAMLHQTSCPTDYECLACGARFGVRSAPARIALGMILITILWVLVAVQLFVL